MGTVSIKPRADDMSLPTRVERDQRAVVAVAHTHEKHRSPERVLALVRKALAPLGGMAQFVKPGQSVLVKPNQTVFYSAEEGCATDPLVVGALIRLAKEAGASRVQVGESSGDMFSSLEAMRISGIAAVAEREGAELLDLGSDDVPNRTVPIPGGRVIQEVPLPAPLLDADVIISVPKAKTHHVEPITGALKNWVGVVNKQWRQQNHGDEDMIGRFMDIMLVSRPTLIVADALIVGEGDGPIANQPHWCGCILASTDPVAIDVSIARLLGLDGTKLRFAREAEQRGLGRRQPIDYVGVALEEVAIHAWQGHAGYDYLPINFLVGKGVTLEGTIGHVKSAVDSMLRRGELLQIIWLKGTPTLMIGDVEDPQFEQHLEEGPYVVFDDAAQPCYKTDSRVHFVPGHPVLRDALPGLLQGLGVARAGQAMMEWQQFQRWGMHNLEYGSPGRQALTVVRPVATAGLAAGLLYAGFRLLARVVLDGDGGGDR
jgi:uncharacterized protein (DUF362 family)